MRVVRQMGAVAGGFLASLSVLLPLAALVFAAVCDLGPRGEVRLSFFPVVLTVYDTLIWTSLGNSLGMAAAVSCVSLVVGVALGSALAARRFWGRPVLSALAIGPLAIPPAFLALGIVGWLGPDAPPSWQGAISALPWTSGSIRQAWSWLTWFGAGSIQGTALVALAVMRALGRIDPDWQAAARLAGGRPARVWWGVTWPMVRPPVYGAVAIVFVATLCEAGVPLILGLRRTIGFQLVVTALGPDPFPRAGAMGVVAGAFGLLVQSLLYWSWAGRPGALARGRVLLKTPARVPAAEGWRGTLLRVVPLSILCLLAWRPVAGLVQLAFSAAVEPTLLEMETGTGPSEFVRRLSDSEVAGSIGQTFLLVLALLILSLVVRKGRQLPRAHQAPVPWLARVRRLGRRIPPLILGAGVLALPRGCELAARLAEDSLGWTGAAHTLIRLEQWSGSFATSGLLVFLGVGLAFLNGAWVAFQTASESDESMPGWIDQALLAGASRRRAQALAARAAVGFRLRTLVGGALLAATSVSPAIVLAPTSQGRPLGPAVVHLANLPGEARRQAAALAIGAIVLNLAGLAWMLNVRRRPGAGPVPAEFAPATLAL